MAKKKINRGEILQAAVKKSGVTVTLVAKRAGVSRGSYYNHTKEPDLPYEILNKYGKAIGHDFSKELPEMISTPGFTDLDVELMSVDQLKAEVMNLRKQYAWLAAKYFADVKGKEK